MRSFFLLFFFFLSFPLLAQKERITHYDIDISINKDRSLEVTETIDVIAAGQTIKRGIVRRLPTYQSGQNVRYQLLEVRRDGREEPYHTSSDGSNLNVYIGEEDVYLDPGNYRYIIRYRALNQVRFFDDFDEVYWNAVGTDWDFPVEAASCTVQLLDSMQVLQTACYTGGYGEQYQECSIELDTTSGQVQFDLTTKLAAREGFTIAVGFQKGLIEPPTFRQKHLAVIVLGAGCLILILFFVITTFKYGIDPPKPAVYAIWEAPGERSPASVGYLLKEKYDPDLLTAAFIKLAVKGYIFIKQSEKKILLFNKTVYDIQRLKLDVRGLPQEERTLMTTLFRDGDTVQIDGSYDSTVKKAVDAFKSALKRQHKAIIKEGRNRKLVNISIVLTVLFAIASFVLIIRSNGRYGGQGEAEVFLIIFFLIFGTIFYFVVSNLRQLIRGFLPAIIGMTILLFFFSVFDKNYNIFSDIFTALKDGWLSLKAPLLRLFSLEFLQQLWDAVSSTYLNLAAFLAFILFSVISIAFYRYVIKRPSKEKQQLRSELEGFKMYLEMTEKDRLELLNPPDRTPALFEKLLPYAYALDVANKWSEQFKEQLEQAAYEPEWSNSSRIYYSSNGFDRSFSRSLASSSTPPSSSGSSGSGGGGSSGGGGGGGGGGGW
jgi:uncharacterized membrane protein YgcG